MGANLSCIDAYAVVESANVVKLHVFAAKHKFNTYHEHIIFDLMTVSNLCYSQ